MTSVDGHTRWLNGYEFGLFGNPNVCALLAQSMQEHGKVYENMVRPFVQQLAQKKQNTEQIENMQAMYWTLNSVRAFAKRPDAHFHLVQADFTGEFNGYGLGLLKSKNKSLVTALGRIGTFYSQAIADIIPLRVLQQSPNHNIRAFYNV